MAFIVSSKTETQMPNGQFMYLLCKCLHRVLCTKSRILYSMQFYTWYKPDESKALYGNGLDTFDCTFYANKLFQYASKTCLYLNKKYSPWILHVSFKGIFTCFITGTSEHVPNLATKLLFLVQRYKRFFLMYDLP